MKVAVGNLAAKGVMGNEQTAIYPLKTGDQVFLLPASCTKADSKKIMILPLNSAFILAQDELSCNKL